MRLGARHLNLPLLLATTAFLACSDQTPTEPVGPDIDLVTAAAPPDGKGPPDGGETTGNNLSYPVIWAEGVTKTLRTPPPDKEYLLDGEWWYQWGTNGVDPDVTPASCAPDPDDHAFCDDEMDGTVGPTPGDEPADNPLPLAKAFLQKDPLNVWQAWSGDAAASGKAELDGQIYVDWIDWGDNLESVDWTIRSQVRTEVVLFEDFLDAKLEYEMRHTSGWGINEVHGMAGTLDVLPAPILGDGMRGTVYSPCARLTLQRLLVDRDDADLANLVWVPGTAEDGGFWEESAIYEGDLINPPIFNMPVYQGGDGPGYYSAEINVKGRVIYGFTWSVRKLNEGVGDYRATFSFDEECGSTTLNTRFVEGHTNLLLPVEEEILAAAAEEGESPGGGAIPVLLTDENLTYIDIRIVDKGGGGGKPGGGRH